MPKLSTLVAVLVSAWSITDAQAFLGTEEKEFAAENYFCTTNSPSLETVAQAKTWLSFLASDQAEEILGDTQNAQTCNGTLQRFVRDGVWYASGPEALSQIVALAHFLEEPPSEPEQRLAHDAEMLGWLTLACMTFTGEEQACITRAVHDLPQQVLVDSPVFCDFAEVRPSAGFMAKYESFADTASFVLCTPLVGDRKADNPRTGWWHRVSDSLFSMPTDEDTEQ